MRTRALELEAHRWDLDETYDMQLVDDGLVLLRKSERKS